MQETCEPERAVYLEPPRYARPLFRQLKGFEDMSPTAHVLGLLKGGYGLKDALRMWRKRLHKALTQLGLKALQADPSLCCQWTGSGPRRLVLIVSTHVDDLKGVARTTTSSSPSNSSSSSRRMHTPRAYPLLFRGDAFTARRQDGAEQRESPQRLAHADCQP